MKILSIGNFSNASWDGSQPDEEHIAKALEKLGHEVTRHQREDPYPVALRGAGGPYDFTLIAQWDKYPDELFSHSQLRYENRSGPIVYWAFDFQEQNQEWHCRLIAASDLYLSKRIEDKRFPNWQWLPQDFAPKFLDKILAPAQKDIEVLFTGSYLPWATERNETLKAIDEKFNLVIHSVNAWHGFKDVRPPIMDEGLPKLYARAKVILSIDHTLERGYWSDRTAQIITCGRRPLFRYIPMSEATFHDDVDYFYSVDDCLKQIEDRLKPEYVEPTTVFMAYTDKYKVKARVKDLLVIVNSIL